MTLMLEPISSGAIPNYFMADIPFAVDMINRLGSPSCVRLQFVSVNGHTSAAGMSYLFHMLQDVYHAQMTQGRLVSTLQTHIGLIHHIQISGVPGTKLFGATSHNCSGRNEPDEQNEINYPFFFEVWPSTCRTQSLTNSGRPWRPQDIHSGLVLNIARAPKPQKDLHGHQSI